MDVVLPDIYLQYLIIKIIGVYYGRPMGVVLPGMIGIEALVTFMGGQGNRRVN